MATEDFTELVVEALDALPPEVRSWLDNVEVVVDDWPTADQLASVDARHPSALLGLYEGVPRTARSADYGMVLPDRITIFRRPILLVSDSVADVRRQVKRTVVHELAHHLGIDDDRLHELGAY